MTSIRLGSLRPELQPSSPDHRSNSPFLPTAMHLPTTRSLLVLNSKSDESMKRPRSLSMVSSSSSSYSYSYSCSHTSSCKKFSLPFKKRRFVLIPSGWDGDQETDDHNDDDVLHSSSRNGKRVRDGSLSRADSKREGPSERDSSRPCTLTPDHGKPSLVSPVPTSARPLVGTSLDASPALPMMAVGVSTSSSVVNNSGSNNKPKRLYHPKLEVPLPNGCHGRTSRTGSFCRRGPNYKGSKYCKLHYCDPRYKHDLGVVLRPPSEPLVVVSASDWPYEPPSSDGNSSSATATDDDEEEDETQPPQDPTPQKLVPPSSSRLSGKPKDRLYRGSSFADEVRCLAISTRGKRCCYAAVAANHNRYCYRHSSRFDPEKSNDEEPRSRTLSSRLKEETADRNPGTASAVTSAPRRRSRAAAAALHLPSTGSERSTSTTTPLNLLSTDQWFEKRVTIRKGPYTSKIGTVVKWRNGWVTVLLDPDTSFGENDRNDHCDKKTTTTGKPGIYHNRRSYELLLL